MSEDVTATTSTPSNDAGAATTADETLNTQGATGEQAPANPTEVKPEAPVVPGAYDLKMPDGVELDKAAADEFTAIAKELKLDLPSAQKLADVAAKQAQRQAESHAKLVESWAEQVKVDKEIGGDKFDENLGIARKALETFGTPELRDVLHASGLGNHPEVIRAFYKAGKAISDDSFVKGAPKGAETDPAKKLFPNMN